METIDSIVKIKEAIQVLEDKRVAQGHLLKEQFDLTYESLKPLNLVKDAIINVSSSPWIIENIIGVAAGVLTGYVSRKALIGASGNVFRRLMGVVLQFGLTNLVARHPDQLKSLGQRIFHHLFHKKEVNSEMP